MASASADYSEQLKDHCRQLMLEQRAMRLVMPEQVDPLLYFGSFAAGRLAFRKLLVVQNNSPAAQPRPELTVHSQLPD